MWKLLSSDPRIVLGVERYGNLFFRQPLTSALFQPERFAEIRPGDTFYENLTSFNTYYEGIEKKFDEAVYLGDKIPLLYSQLDTLFSNIGQAKVVFMLRNIFDVAASYEARANDAIDESWSKDKRTAEAILEWRDSLRALERFLDDKRVLPVLYEDFFSGKRGFGKLYRFLELDCTVDNRRAYRWIVARDKQLEIERTRRMPKHDVMRICMEAPFGLYRKVVNRITPA